MTTNAIELRRQRAIALRNTDRQLASSIAARSLQDAISASATSDQRDQIAGERANQRQRASWHILAFGSHR